MQNPIKRHRKINKFEIFLIYILGNLSILLLLVPQISESFTQSKWLALYLFGFAALISIFLSKEAWYFRYSRPAKSFGSVISNLVLIFGIISLSINFVRFNTLLILRILSIFSLSIFYIQFFRCQSWYKIFLKCFLFGGGIALLNQDLSWLIGLEWPLPSSFFGHVNMTAEFYGYLVFITVASFFFFSSRLIRIAIGAIGVNALLWIWILQSRTVFLAVTLSILYILSHQFRQKISKKHIGFGAILILVFAIFLVLPNINLFHHPILDRLRIGEIDHTKMNSAQIRKIRWMNTGRLIADHPFGTGFQSYEFTYLSYKNAVLADHEVGETILSFSPHNTFLDIAAEHGLGLSLSLYLGIFYLLFKSYKMIFLINDKQKVLELTTVAGTMIFLLALGIFAFPLENAWTFSLGLFSLTYLLSQFSKPIKIEMNSKSCISFFVVVVLHGALTGAFLFTKYSEQQFVGELEMNSLACGMFSSEWRVCLNEVKNLLYLSRPGLALTKLNQEIQRHPNNFIALLLKANTLEKLGKRQDACQVMKMYENLVGTPHSLSNYQSDLCEAGPK